MIICSYSDKILIVIGIGALVGREKLLQTCKCISDSLIKKSISFFAIRITQYNLKKIIHIKQACDTDFMLSVSHSCPNSWKC